jgi:uncharacterized spore protein YtfJ
LDVGKAVASRVVDLAVTSVLRLLLRLLEEVVAVQAVVGVRVTVGGSKIMAIVAVVG